jgi:hypothetical protein
MKKIIDYLKLVGFIDDESVAYNVPSEGKPPYSFSLDEYRAFTESIFEDAGGWDNAEEYVKEDAYFETYVIPFKFESEDFILVIMFGQGSSWMLMTPQELENYNQRCKDVVDMYPDEEI